MTKFFLSTVLAGLCTITTAKPARLPVYEPDGESVSGKAVKVANLFLNAKTTATGQFEEYAPRIAVDGKSNDSARHWCAENLPQALTVDMGTVKTPSEIRFVPYWVDGRVYGFKIEDSSDSAVI